MAFVWTLLLDVLQRWRMAVDVFTELVLFFGPLWIAVLIGVLIGWAWKPRWAYLGKYESDGCTVKDAESDGWALPLLSLSSWPISYCGMKQMLKEAETTTMNSECGSLPIENEKLVVNNEDLEHLCQLVDAKDGGPAWQQMMDRTTLTMSYQAWRRDPKVGPTQYRTRSVFEDATPELVRDFFWDDEFRSKWDDMLLSSETLEECPTTGTMVVHWIRKFPFFCSDREYTIGRRIWQSGKTYYCVTKGVPHSLVPRRNKPRRVDLYYSSWCIRPVESRRGDGQLTACEVLLFHHEDMGIPGEIAKLGVRQGMWGAVKKVEPGLRAFQTARKSGILPSRCTLMTQISTKINDTYLKSLETTEDSSEVKTLNSQEKQLGRNIPKFLIVGGAVALACSLDHGLLTKAVIFGIARRFPMFGGRR
ncbi:uncharacterized protein LOC131233256 isoform X2 [Magnolia sinica]|uniref:uncharacterized protein LOC131233256 isoform X2 n=1 Tax=Magnolia sinica TaxID=86752 RepID=UPI00265A447D|nr:uncharacterized protein LOC131233256 isoform X2 [Magnolia sinica]